MLSLLLVTGVSACSPEDYPPDPEVPEQPVYPDEDDKPGEPENPADPDRPGMRIRIGNAVFTATLQDNATAKALRGLLPMKVNMSELNNNEKYYYLLSALPTDASAPGTIRSGEIMLYGSDCLVLFYKTFSTGYRYTRIGAIDDPAGLENALGGSSVVVSLETVE